MVAVCESMTIPSLCHCEEGVQEDRPGIPSCLVWTIQRLHFAQTPGKRKIQIKNASNNAYLSCLYSRDAQNVSSMFSRLLFLFIFIPIAELYLLIMVGARIGFLPTLGLIVFTGILGASLARQQGLSTLAKIQSELQSGRPPTDKLIEGAMIVVGGIVLITPGILTDLFGFALMVPSFRKRLAGSLKKSFGGNFSTIRPNSGGKPGDKESFKNSRDDVIDVWKADVKHPRIIII